MGFADEGTTYNHDTSRIWRSAKSDRVFCLNFVGGLARRDRHETARVHLRPYDALEGGHEPKAAGWWESVSPIAPPDFRKFDDLPCSLICILHVCISVGHKIPVRIDTNAINPKMPG